MISPPWRYFRANPKIIEKLDADKNLFFREDISHSYPHCWRCKEPIIFRATEQWFISMDKDNLRKKALEAVKKVNWIPSWGELRITRMIETRGDWCISRQRVWGIPLPIWRTEDGKEEIAIGSIEELKAEMQKSVKAGWMQKDILVRSTWPVWVRYIG